MKKDLLSIKDLSNSDIEFILDLSKKYKYSQKTSYTPLQGKTLAMIFKKPSTRTRVSFEVGMGQLGGQSIFLNTNDIQMGRGESIADTARILTGYVDGILIRTFAQSEVEQLAEYAGIPVINALTDKVHPCQILADLFTIKDKLGTLKGVKIAYIGDGNNIANSWLLAAGKTGLKLTLAVPYGYEPDSLYLEAAEKQAVENGGYIKVSHDLYEAVCDVDIVYTDVWTSMGQEAEQKKRLADFAGYEITRELIKTASPEVLIMHCLPVHRGEEISAEVIDGKRSIVFEQAANRLHANKAILMLLLG